MNEYNKYQNFILKRIIACLSSNMEFSEDKCLIDMLNDEGDLVITQDENYNIKKRYLLLESKIIDYVVLDGKRIDCTLDKTKRNEGFVIVPFDFEKRAKQLKLYFKDNINNAIDFNIIFSEVDHKFYDAKIQDELNKKIEPEHNVGIDLVNIYWDLVSDKVASSQINLYYVSKTKRLVGKYEQIDSTFKSITGLAFGTYCYEIIEFDGNKIEIARTENIEFVIKKPRLNTWSDAVVIR